MPYKDPEQRRAYDRAYTRARYDRLTGVELNLRLLQTRRSKALARLRQLNKED